MHEPWKTIHQVAEHALVTYAPGDDSPNPGRADFQFVQDALYAARLALEGARNTPEGDRTAEACRAVGALLRVLHRVLTGMSGDLRDLADRAGELAEGLEWMRGSGPE